MRFQIFHPSRAAWLALLLLFGAATPPRAEDARDVVRAASASDASASQGADAGEPAEAPGPAISAEPAEAPERTLLSAEPAVPPPRPAPLLERSPLSDPHERAQRIEAHRPPLVAVEPGPAAASSRRAQAEAQLQSAKLLEGVSDWTGAREAWARAIGLGAESAESWSGLARARARTGDFDGSEAALLAALDQPEGQDVTYIELAEFYAWLDRPVLAQEALAEAELLTPESPRVVALVSSLRADWQPTTPARPPGTPILWPEPAPRAKLDQLRDGFWWAYASLPPSWARRVDGAREALGTPEGQRIAFGVLLGVLLVLLAPRLLRQRGDLGVSIHYPSELRGTFRVRLSTQKARIKPSDPASRLEVRKGGSSSRTEHHLVSRETHFRRVPARRYFVVVDGVLEDPESGEVLSDVFERKVERVRPRRTVRVEFDLHPSSCPVDVVVRWDGNAPRDAAVTAPALSGAVFDASREAVRLPLSKGTHTLVVGSGDRVVEHDVEVRSYRPMSVVVDIAQAERVIFRGCPPAVEPYLMGDLPAVARALERDGQGEQAHLLLARKHHSEGRIEAAAERFEAAGHSLDAAELRSELGDMLRAGALFQQADEPLRAAQAYEEAQEPLRAGEAYEAAREFEDAVRCYREAGETSKCVDALDRSGDTLGAAKLALDNGWRARAIRLLRTMTQDDPNYSEASSLLADAFEREGHWDLAAQKLEDHISVAGPGGGGADLQSRLADLFEKAGNGERALGILEDLRRREPTYPNVKTRIELLRKKRSAVQAVMDSKPSPIPDYAPTTFLSDYRYEILEELGRGGMGVVFKARDRRLSRVVALKRLPESLKNYPRAVQLFLREAQATARLNHPNIVTVFDADQEDDTFFITMELLEGQPMHVMLHEQEKLTPAEVAKLGVQMAEGLQYAHDQLVVHRDIKTANFFLTEEGVVKIMDFGLAKTLEEMRRAETGIGGTPFYMAPEQVLGGDVDHRADLYSLGATLFELSTGRVPFPDGDVTYHHRHTAPPDPRSKREDLPEDLALLILELLEKDVEARVARADIVGERLQSLL